MIWILLTIVVILILIIWLKPYFIKLNCTLLFTGEMGTGKTYSAVDKAIKAYKGRLWRVKISNWFTKQLNKIIKKHNIITTKKGSNPKYKGKTWNLREEQPLPRLISNIPVRIKGGKKPIWSNVLEKEMLTFAQKEGEIIKIPEGSILLIDELPQMVDQFNWDIPDVQNNLNEFITFIRHYFNGILIITAQAEGQTVKPIREKMTTYYKLANWRRFLHFFYAVDVIQLSGSDLVQNHTDGFMEDNMKTTYGILHKNRYNSRCYAPRYQDLPENKNYKFKMWHKDTTKRIIRFDDYISPLDPKQKGQQQ